MPGPKDLWAVSVHLLTSSSATRNAEATQLVSLIQQNVPVSDYLVIGGDLNTGSVTEACLSTFSGVVSTVAPFPADQNGNSNTSAARSTLHDWVMANPQLRPRQTEVVIGASHYASGLVFDSRVFTPLAQVAPVLFGDSGAVNMQHMAVAKDFLVPQ